MQYNDVENLKQDMQAEGELIQPKSTGGFFQRHRFLMGFLTSFFCVLFFCVITVAVLRSTGQILVIGEAGASTVKSGALLTDAVIDKIDEIYSYINIYYYEDFEKEDIYNSIYDGVAEALNDPYSVYYTEEEYAKLQESTTGIYYGIGAGLSQDLETMQVTITKVYRGTPSEEAGLQQGDILLYVEDMDAASMEVSEIVKHIRGEEGTTVYLKVYRESSGETLEFEVERRNVELPSVEGEMLDNGIAYIQITEFQSKTDEQFAEMAAQFQAQGMKGLIIDVRANPGGLLSSVVNLLDTVLPEGLLVYIEDKYGNRESKYSDAACMNLPIVVLIDENSASASEIFAGALKDYQYATLVGKTTFGKGIVQNIIPLSDGDAIKLTTAKYFTPNGNYIHGVGITPDVEVDYAYTGDVDASYDKQYDSQFLKALEIMEGMLVDE